MRAACLTHPAQAKVSAGFAAFMAIEERDTNRSLFDRRDPDTFKALVLKYASASKHTSAWFAGTVTQKKQDSLLRELVAMINPYPRLMAQIQVSSRTRARRV